MSYPFSLRSSYFRSVKEGDCLSDHRHTNEIEEVDKISIDNMIFNPHKLGVHKVLKYIPLNAFFDAPYKRMLAKAVNIADLRLIAKARAHKVRKSCSLP